MKQFRLMLLMTAILAIALAGSPFLLDQANAQRRGAARGGGGFSRGAGAGGFSGGSFRGGGTVTQGPRGGAVAQGPRGGVAAQGPRGATAAQGPRGGQAVKGPGGYGAARGPAGNVATRGPGGTSVNGRPSQLPAGGSYQGNVNVNRNVTVNQGWSAWGGYYGPGAVAAGVAAGVAVGAAVAALPPAYQTVVVNNHTYYVANGTYYQPCYQGAAVSYCVVVNPYR